MTARRHPHPSLVALGWAAAISGVLMLLWPMPVLIDLALGYLVWLLIRDELRARQRRRAR